MFRRVVRVTALGAVLVAAPMVVVGRWGESASYALGDQRLAKDVNSDPRVVEVDLEAREATVELVPGKPTKVWAYNGSVPGPLIVSDLGSEVIVHLRNRLPQPNPSRSIGTASRCRR